MPLFEYACTTCRHQFEWLTRAGETPECPSCHATALERRHSTFAARASESSSAPTQVPMGACGACGDPRGPGACAIN
jgi:putative FmdB family regulatory protein